MYQQTIAILTLELENTNKQALELDKKAEAIYNLLKQVEEMGTLPKNMGPDDLILLTQQMTYLDEAKTAINKLSQVITMRLNKYKNLQQMQGVQEKEVTTPSGKIRKLNPNIH